MLQEIQSQVSEGKWRLTFHAFERCVERNISPKEILEVILVGEIQSTGRTILEKDGRRDEMCCMQ